MNKIINKLHQSSKLGFFIKTLDYCLQKELKDCSSVLDLGCGPSSPIKRCRNIKYSVGVEPFLPYLNKSKKQKIHNKYIAKNVEKIAFPKKSFDAVIMIEVIEHLPKRSGLLILKKAEKWAKKKVIISCPNGFLKQKELDNNPMQKHLSGWDSQIMNSKGYECHGLAGIKWLRHSNEDHAMGDDLTSSIKFQPKLIWFIVSTISQIFMYYIPKLSFEIFCVKRLDQ